MSDSEKVKLFLGGIHDDKELLKVIPKREEFWNDFGKLAEFAQKAQVQNREIQAIQGTNGPKVTIVNEKFDCPKNVKIVRQWEDSGSEGARQDRGWQGRR